ncbi:MAG: ArsR family transcriptional regulator [Desulfobacteraceae bacterium]|nr:MAG: ArsR family transcriptional regulator [Desulfobacteraceae bacterium]
MSTNIENCRIKTVTSRIVEIAGFLYLLSHPDSRKSIAAQAYDIRKKLPPELLEILGYLAQLKFSGFEIIEFILKSKIYDDLSDLEYGIAKWNHAPFLHIFFGQEIPEQRIEEALQNTGALDSLQPDFPWIADKIDCLRFIISNPDRFRAGLSALLKQLDNAFLTDTMNQLAPLYQEKMAYIHTQLQTKTPLDLAQEIMGKKFKRVNDYKEYIFIPSYFFPLRPVRFMDDYTQILIDPIPEPDSLNGDRKRTIDTMKAIADPTRFEILNLILKEPLYGKQIAEKLNLSTPTISHHLDVLKAVDLITEERIQNIKYFSTSPGRINRFLTTLRKHLLQK